MELKGPQTPETSVRQQSRAAQEVLQLQSHQLLRSAAASLPALGTRERRALALNNLYSTSD